MKLEYNELIATEDKDGEKYFYKFILIACTKEGDKVTIDLCDENGNEIQATGIVT